jgi:hypothetical protein
LETMFERTFCGNDVWILSPPATSLDESWKGDDGDDHLSHLDWWSPVRCHVAEKPSFSHCVFIVPADWKRTANVRRCQWSTGISGVLKKPEFCWNEAVHSAHRCQRKGGTLVVTAL